MKKAVKALQVAGIQYAALPFRTSDRYRHAVLPADRATLAARGA